jgi:hypothetical protein
MIDQVEMMMSRSTYGRSPNLNLDVAPCFIYRPFSRYMLGWSYCNIFICLTLVPIYIDPWKSFMTFGIKKSHEMISYMLVGMTLLSAGIALLSGWKYRSSTKPCNLAQMTLDGLYNKSRKRFVLSKCPKNAPIDQKG